MNVGDHIRRAEAHLASAKREESKANDELVALDLKLTIEACASALAQLVASNAERTAV